MSKQRYYAVKNIARGSEPWNKQEGIYDTHLDEIAPFRYDSSTVLGTLRELIDGVISRDWLVWVNAEEYIEI